MNHHGLFTSFAKTDRTLLFLNLTLLLFIAAIPFGAATMAAYLRGSVADAHLAAALHAAIFEGAGLSFTAIFVWSIRDGRRHEPLPPGTVRHAVLRFSIGALVYLVAIALAFISAPATLVLIAAVAVYYIFEQTSDEPIALDSD